MDVIYKAHAIGSRTKFYEDNGEFPRKQVGDTVEGELQLCSIGSDQYRIAFNQPRVMAAGNGAGLFRSLFRHGESGNSITFEFTSSEVRSKTKQFSFWTATVGCAEMFVIECYDLNTHNGSWYRFDDDETAKKWARTLHISKLRYYDEEGNVEKETPF